ncbi:MAG: glutamine--fructose-6-phosphate transaminase (isomerizing), partial [Elusimicrobia bacterium]|nr:glutamine--fructose-6-phosphate transaminase (isomerizing) [Elusimicrobiota bacterium]
MCGIIGYTGGKDCAPIIINGLKRLEYRGYDSAGIAVIFDGSIELRRSVGKVDALLDILAKDPLSGLSGIGHTRWATHGRPSEENAHPHTDCSRKLVVVHNGVIENYLDIKEDLAKKGHKFKSETDTEVIAHLIEEKINCLSKPRPPDKLEPVFFEACRLALKEIKGSYAIAVVWTMCPKTVLGARRYSPLIVGAGEGENFIASDIPAFLDYTRKVYYLNDEEIAVLSPDGAEFFNLEGNRLKKNSVTVEWDRAMAEKSGYRHFMLKEIHEQPDSVEETLRGRLLPFDDNMLSREFGMDSDFAKRLERIQIIACGTAFHAGLCGKYALEHFAGLPVSVVMASEFRHREIPLEKNTLLITISQSGETADTLSALRETKRYCARTLAICNVVGSSLTREADFTFYTHCGPEIAVASTKAFSGQLTALYMLALHLGAARGKLSAEQAKTYAEEMMKIPSLMRKTLAMEPKMQKIAKKFADRGHYLFLGRGANYPIALEGALKIKEISYVHAEGFAGGEMKHGPIAIITEGMPALGIAVESRSFEKMLGNMSEAQARGAHVIAIVTEGSNGTKIKADCVLEVPRVNEFFSPLITVI